MTSEDDLKASKDSLARAGQAGREVKHQAKGTLDEAPDAAADLYGRARAKARDVADGLPESAGDALASGHQALRSSGDQVARRVTKQPIEALMLAGAIGYLIGWAVNRD